jgi:predicted component of type VI protein secretion system
MNFSQQNVIASTGVIKGVHRSYKKIVDFVHLVRYAKLYAKNKGKTLQYRTIVSTAPVIAGVIVEDGKSIQLYSGIMQIAGTWNNSLFPVECTHQLMVEEIEAKGYSAYHQYLDKLNTKIIELYYRAQTKYTFDFFRLELSEASITDTERCLEKLEYLHSKPTAVTTVEELSVADIRYAIYYQFGLNVMVKQFYEDKIPVKKRKLGSENLLLGRTAEIGNFTLDKTAGICIQINCSDSIIFRNIVAEKLEKVGLFAFKKTGERLTVNVVIKTKTSTFQKEVIGQQVQVILGQGSILGNPRNASVVNREKTWFAMV